jgi:rhodanese-related sulfurtransferase
MKKIHLVILFAGLLFTSCSNGNSEEAVVLEEVVETQVMPIEHITSNQIKSAHLKLSPALFKIKLDNSPEITLLDIRTAEELLENGTIEGAKNVDFYDEIVFKKTILSMDKELPVMLYCRSGGRSSEASAMLKDLGFKQVYDLNGGYNAWLAAFPNK